MNVAQLTQAIEGLENLQKLQGRLQRTPKCKLRETLETEVQRQLDLVEPLLLITEQAKTAAPNGPTATQAPSLGQSAPPRRFGRPQS